MMNAAKHRREFMRWLLLLGLYNARPVGAWEEVLLSIVRSFYADCTKLEMRQELDYLHDRKLLGVRKHPDGRWHSELNNHGVDYVEYTIDGFPGIARPDRSE